jgi:Tfp pilus assembly protein PilP
VEELTVRGIVSSPSGLVAMVQSPDRKTYLVRQNDKLLDGIVKSVTAEGLVILQEVNDPLSLVKQKEVRKMLHGNEEGK